MNEVRNKLDLVEKSPRMSTFAVLYGNLILNIFYGIIYVLLHKILFPETWTNIAISVVFAETVILFYAIITSHDKKFFMLGWTIFMILLSASFIVIRIVHLMRENGNWSKDWDRCVGEVVMDMNDQLHEIFSKKLAESLSEYASLAIESFILMTIIFKYYSAWTIYQDEFRRKSKISMIDIFFFGETRRSSQPVIVSSA